jgi:hypothetical protein
MSMCTVEQDSNSKFKAAKKTAAGPGEESVLLAEVIINPRST